MLLHCTILAHHNGQNDFRQPKKSPLIKNNTHKNQYSYLIFVNDSNFHLTIIVVNDNILIIVKADIQRSLF